MKDLLRSAADGAASIDEFIRAIQQSDALFTRLHEWEYETPERAERFKHTGWFGVAAAYWDEHTEEIH